MLYILILILVTTYTIDRYQDYHVTTIRDYNITEKEVGSTIQPQMFWTYKYINEQFPFLVNDTLIHLKSHQAHPRSKHRVIHQALKSIVSVDEVHYISQEETPGDINVLHKNLTAILKFIQSRIHIKICTKILNITHNNGYIVKIMIEPKPDFGYTSTESPGTGTLSPFKTTAIIAFDTNFAIKDAYVDGLPRFTNHIGYSDPVEKYASPFIHDHPLINADPETAVATLMKERKDYRDSGCFARGGELETNQDNLSTMTGCVIAGKIWDTRCDKNSDCPFYRMNKVYPNDFGGCDQLTGHCQFPTGITPIGYRKYKGKPRCYCGGQIKDCCDEQANPDYAFQEDISLRNKYNL